MKKSLIVLLCGLFLGTAMAQMEQQPEYTAKEEICNPATNLTVRYTEDCSAELQWTAPSTKYTAVSGKNTVPSAPKGMVNVTLESHVWSYQRGYQLLLDQTATQYGITIPASGPFSWNCNLPEDYYDVFSHKIPENADPVCTSQNIVVDGAVTVQIPAGTYDWCVADLDPSGGIFVAGESGAAEHSGRRNDFIFEEGYDYHILVRRFDYYIGIEVTRPCATISNLNVTVDNHNATLTWDAAPNFPTGYQILRNEAVLDTVTTTSHTDSNAPDGMYTYGVKALFEGDCDTKAVYAEEVIIGSVCTVRFEMFDAYGIWDGDAAVRIEVNGTDYGTVKLMESGHATEIRTIPAGEVNLYWIPDGYDEECYLEVYDHNDQLLWASPVGVEYPGGPGDGMYDYDGLFFTWQNDCGSNPPLPEVYRIYRDSVPVADNYTGTSYTDSGFDAYEGHTWSVRVVCNDMESEPVSVTLGNCRNEPPDDPCNPPTGLTVDYTNNCEAELAWNAPAKQIPLWDFTEDVKVEKPTVTNAASTDRATFSHRSSNQKPAVAQGNMSKNYAEAYVSDFTGGVYSSVSLTSGVKTPVAGMPDLSAFPTGEDYSGTGLYRLYSNGVVVLVHEDGTISEAGQISDVTHCIGLAYDWINDNGTWYFYDIPQVAPPYTAMLYALNMATFQKTLITETPASDAFYRGLAMGNDGALYALDMTGFNLVKFVNDQIVTVGSLGFPTAYGQDLAFDRETDILYASPLDMTNPTVPDCKFGTVDTATGAFSLIRTYTGGEQHATLSILKGMKQNAAAAPDNFTVTPVNTSLKTNISWNNPSTTLGGNSLQLISKMVLTRNGQIIHEFTTAALGGAMNWQDEVPNIGKYTYSVYAVTGQESGATVYRTVYSGDFCTIRFEMADHYHDGWGSGTVTAEVDGTVYGNVTLESGVAFGAETLTVPSGELKLYWTDSDANQECGLQVYGAGDQLIFASGEPAAWTTPCAAGIGMCGMSGLFYTGQYNCGGSVGNEVYNIYRDNILIVENHASTSWLDTEFNPTTAHTWAVATVCTEGESDRITVNGGICAKYTVTLSVSPDEGGSVSGGNTYAHGESATITATPAVNYTFVNWTEDGIEVTDAEAEYTFTVTGNRTLVANFALQQFEVTFTVTNENGEPVEGASIVFNGETLAGYIASGVPAGEYNYTVSKTGYTTATGTVEVIDQNVTEEVTLGTVGIHDNTLTGIHLHPNPFTDEITVSNPAAVRNIQITDAAGQKVKEVALSSKTISTGELSSGVYFVTIEIVTGEKAVYKMVKK